ncbi:MULTISPECIES: DUF6629 family protein [unclassified Streptomyces]|uniref:DUF6629 family protein n=1 Tax=unclassified Streptomyces TaxID=2593676 RepID=UPI00099CA410|nr:MULTISPECIES: DUF6629 family protein [unclassified Streptomyces]
MGHPVATVGALLLSGDRRLRVLGVLAGAGAPACRAPWRLESVSTWCAFAVDVVGGAVDEDAEVARLPAGAPHDSDGSGTPVSVLLDESDTYDRRVVPERTGTGPVTRMACPS